VKDFVASREAKADASDTGLAEGAARDRDGANDYAKTLLRHEQPRVPDRQADHRSVIRRSRLQEGKLTAACHCGEGGQVAPALPPVPKPNVLDLT
jgi:hypothetical protein